MSTKTEFLKNSPPHTPEEVLPDSPAVQHFGAVDTTDPVPLFCDLKPPCLSSDSTVCNIDYIPSHDLASQYVDLPLLNFELNEVVADRNRDPSILDIPTFDYIVPQRVSSPTQKDKFLVFPPNLTSIVGLRTLLLNRRNLLNWANENLNQVLNLGDDKLAETKRKFDERIWCLFLWPALMSRYEPSSNDSVFLYDETILKKNSFLAGLNKSKRVDVLAATGQSLTGTDTHNIDAPSTSGLSISNTKFTKRKSSNSGPASKRRKFGAKEEGEDSDDPDDPDEVMDID